MPRVALLTNGRKKERGRERARERESEREMVECFALQALFHVHETGRLLAQE